MAIHTRIKGKFEVLIDKIATGGFYTLDVSPLREANNKTHKSCGRVMVCWGRREGERLKKSM